MKIASSRLAVIFLARTTLAITLPACAAAALLLLLAACQKGAPGQAEFQQANEKITLRFRGSGFGNTPEAEKAAGEVAAAMKTLQAAYFHPENGKAEDDDRDFAVYCRQNARSVVFMIHVPDLRNYRDAEPRETLAKLAWSAANDAAKPLVADMPNPLLMVALRGFSAYGPIWSGRAGGPAREKSDDPKQMPRLYPFFASGPDAR